MTAVDRNGRVKREVEVAAEETFDMDVGDGNAHVANTRELKKWASDRDHGLTVGAAVTVTLTCNQDKKTIRLAARMAGAMAERFVREGITEMNEYFDQG